MTVVPSVAAPSPWRREDGTRYEEPNHKYTVTLKDLYSILEEKRKQYGSDIDGDTAEKLPSLDKKDKPKERPDVHISDVALFALDVKQYKRHAVLPYFFSKKGYAWYENLGEICTATYRENKGEHKKGDWIFDEKTAKNLWDGKRAWKTIIDSEYARTH